MDVSLSLVPSEERSRSFIATLTVQNNMSEAVDLVAVIPTAGSGVTVERSAMEVAEDEVSDYRRLCHDLQKIANSTLTLRVAEHRAAFTNEVIRSLREVLRPRNFMELYLKIMLSIVRPSRDKFKEQFSEQRLIEESGLLLPIYSVAQAERVKTICFPPTPPNEDAHRDDHSFVETVFNEKLERLKHLESENKSYGNTVSNRELRHGDQYSRTFVIECRRDALARSSHTIGFLLEFVTHKNERFTKEVQSSVNVSANPLSLSLVAAVSALAAGIVDVQDADLANESQDSSEPSIVDLILNSFSGAGNIIENVFGPVFLAVVVFNIYENLDVAKNIPRTVSWRTAVFVGFLTGLLSENVVGGFTALLG